LKRSINKVKTRQSLVSNSSSTSFCIYGIQLNGSIDDDIILPILKEKFPVEYEIASKLCIATYKREISDTIIDYIFSSFGLEKHSSSDSGEVWIGRPLSSIEDDETGGQFKKKVADVLNVLYPSAELSIHEESCYNG
jgi:hypothetical protein